MASGRERATSKGTLVCLLQAVQELRNESSANSDGFMNISMSDGKFSKQNGQEVTFKFPILLTCGRLLKNS